MERNEHDIATPVAYVTFVSNSNAHHIHLRYHLRKIK